MVLTAGQVEHLLAVDGGVKAPIEALQRLRGLEGSPPRERLLGPAFDLIFAHAFETLDVGPLPLDGLPVAGLPCGQHAREAERLQLRGSLVVELHEAPPARSPRSAAAVRTNVEAGAGTVRVERPSASKPRARMRVSV